MNTTTLTRDGARVIGTSAVVLAATLAALLAVFVLAKPLEAQDPILTVNPSSVDFGNVTVGATPEEQTVTVTNTGGTDLVLGGFNILGVDSGAFTSSLNLGEDLTLAAGDTATFTVSFDPVETGLQTAQLTFNSVTDTLGNNVSGVEAPTVNLTGQGVSANPRGSGCTITGSNNSETLRGTRGNDVICAMGGRDKVKPLGGKDVTRAGSGNDKVIDRSGVGDKLLGQRGNDTLNAKDRNRDLLNGAGGRDTCAKNRGDKVRSC
jgi:Ca2+-binding RTX toxin-like protein